MQQRATSRPDASQRLKVLHIGNIANNAYMAASILNAGGFDCDVLVADYYHIGGSAEWESAEIEGDWGNDFFPSWHKVNLHGFSRPAWFAQGPRHIAMSYLIARRKGEHFKAKILWKMMSIGARAHTMRKRPFDFGYPIHVLARVYSIAIAKFLSRKDEDMTRNKLMGFKIPGIASLRPAQSVATLAEKLPRAKLISTQIKRDQFGEMAERRATPTDFEYILWKESEVPLLKRLFSHYDIIIGYSTDGVWPLLLSKPYIAFEHGTIRRLPFENTIQGRLTAATYKEADAVLITNSDVRSSAKKLGLVNYKFIPHPTQEQFYEEQRATAMQLRELIKEQRNVDFIVFHPSRHHWVVDERDPNWEKGNDLTIRAFAQLVSEHKVRAVLIAVEAGQTVDKSKKLIAELGISSRVMWMKTQPHRSFARYLMASDVIVDQFHRKPLAFGGIPPKAMLAGVPVIANFSESCLEWCYDEMPPIINVSNVDEICGAMVKLQSDKEYAERVIATGRYWYKKYYSNEVFYKIASQEIRGALERRKQLTLLKPASQ